MIFWGIVLLVVGIIIWAVARRTPLPVFVVVLGDVVGIIGALLLLVGIVLLVIPASGMDITPR